MPIALPCCAKKLLFFLKFCIVGQCYRYQSRRPAVSETIYRTRVRSLAMLVTHSLTDSLTHCHLVNLIDVTLAFEDADSKLVEVVTVADEARVGNSLLQI